MDYHENRRSVKKETTSVEIDIFFFQELCMCLHTGEKPHTWWGVVEKGNGLIYIKVFFQNN